MADIGVISRDDFVLNAIFNPHNPLEILEDILKIDNEAEKEIGENLKQLEIDAVNAAQAGKFHESLNMFNELLEQVPNYASGYNNRAQLLRLQGDNESASDDLNKAIDLCNDKGFVASQAHVQKGLLYHLNGDHENFLSEFKKAAHLGNKFAKQHLVSINPYAALCNKMLAKVFAKETNPTAAV